MADAEFNGKTVVVTGTGDALGMGIARRFGQAGASVVVTDADGVTASYTAEALRTENVSASSATLDVADPAQSTALVEKLIRERGRIDVWVNAARGTQPGPAETLLPAAWDEVLRRTLSGAFYCSQAAGKQMLAQGEGVIVNVASVDGYQPIEERVARSVVDAGLIMLTKALGIEWAPRGVRVVGVAPGPMVGLETDGKGAETDAYERRTPMGRLGTIRDLAEAVLYIASSQASYVVAETLRVDGGWVAYQLF
jgi:NAD(P)-dependent dehydrogenase (short-subunit alcohol dehydrogenase family)